MMTRSRKESIVRGIFLATALASTVLLSASATGAEKPKDYPKGPINFIVPFGAGGGSDVGARILASVAEKYVGAPLVVQNKPGAGGGIGWASLSLSKPDGYTIALNNIPAMILLPLMGTTNFKFEDFVPIMCLVDDPALLMVRKGGKFANFEDFLKYAKENPGKLTVGTSGAGTDSHVVVEMINQRLGIKLNPVPFNGANESVTSMLGGHTDASLPKTSEAISAMESGEALLLGTFTEERLPQYPDLPTMKEMGLDISYSSSRGLVAPKGTPPEIVAYLEDALRKATEDPDYLAKMKNAGLPVKYMSGKEFRDFYMKQYEAFKPVVEKINAAK